VFFKEVAVKPLHLKKIECIKHGKRIQKQDQRLVAASFIKKAAIATAGFYIVPDYVLGGKGIHRPKR
jgi:hypothetical protein